MRIVELVLGLVVVVHFREHGDAAIPAAAMIVRGEFRSEPADDARDDQ